MANLKFLWRFAAPVKWLLLLAVVLMIFESLSFLSIIGLQQQLIDEVIMQRRFDMTLEMALLFALAFVCYALLFTFGPHAIHKATASIQGELILQFMTYMYRIPPLRLQAERTATFVHYITQDIERVADLAGNQLVRGIQKLVSVLLLAVMIAVASPLLLALCLGISVLYIYLGKLFAKRMQHIAREVQENRARLLVLIEEGISSTREVLAFHRLEWEAKLYRACFQAYYSKVMEEGKLDNVKLLASEPFNWGVRLLILGYGGYLVMQSQISIGMFVVIFQFGSQFVEGLQGLFHSAMQIAGSSASIERVRHVMEGEQLEERGERLTAPLRELRLDGVSFRYGEKDPVVLDGLSIEIPVCKKVAFVGTSGGGKSTIAGLLIRNFDPLAGKVLVNDRPINHWKRADWMRKIGIVLQEPYLFPDTIRTNLVMGLEQVEETDIIAACKAAQIHAFIMSLPLQYGTIIGDRGITLSGGQRQRLAIARALIRDPELLILDETTSSLDLETERQLQGAIDELRAGKTTIIIAHRLSTIRNADAIFVMDQGRVAESGKHDELVSKDSIYKQLVLRQAAGE